MSKAVLVIDMPNNCDECEFCGLSVEDTDKRSCLFDGSYMLYDFDVGSGRHECCPLRPLPSQKYLSLKDEHDDIIFQTGWNACIDEILGETE